VAQGEEVPLERHLVPLLPDQQIQAAVVVVAVKAVHLSRTARLRLAAQASSLFDTRSKGLRYGLFCTT
jgi:hypothetical protein